MRWWNLRGLALAGVWLALLVLLYIVVSLLLGLPAPAGIEPRPSVD